MHGLMIDAQAFIDGCDCDRAIKLSERITQVLNAESGQPYHGMMAQQVDADSFAAKAIAGIDDVKLAIGDPKPWRELLTWQMQDILSAIKSDIIQLTKQHKEALCRASTK